MADPILTISIENGTPVSALTVENGKRFDVTYIIKPNGNKNIRIVFPVFDINDDNADQALFYKSDWSKAQLTILSPSSATFSIVQNQIGVFVIKTDGSTEVQLKISVPENPLLIIKKGISPVVNESIWVLDNSGVTTKWVQKSAVSITIADDIKPSIFKFISDKLFVGQNGQATLNWEVVNADSITITNTPLGNSTDSLPTEKRLKGTSTITNIISNITFTLTAHKTGHNDVSISLSITVIPTSSFAGVYSDKFSNQKIMGLYNYNDQKLYALINEQPVDNSTIPNVFFWESYDGVNWARTTVYNLRQPFISNMNKNNVPLEFAGSPGVVFNSKLYLIGGSRYNVNITSNEVYCYDFTADIGWHKIEATSDLPTKRMGHSIVVFNNQIWMMGGITEFGDVSNEVWTFDGIKWTKLQQPMNDVRCMASAIVWKNQIQLFGGFGEVPGFADKSIFNSLCFDGTAWKTLDFKQDKSRTTPFYFSNCAAAVWQSSDQKRMERFLFVQYEDGGIQNVTYQITITSSPITTKVMTGIVTYSLADDWYNIQTATFKEVIYQCGLKNDEDNPTANEKLNYFVFIS